MLYKSVSSMFGDGNEAIVLNLKTLQTKMLRPKIIIIKSGFFFYIIDVVYCDCLPFTPKISRQCPKAEVPMK